MKEALRELDFEVLKGTVRSRSTEFIHLDKPVGTVNLWDTKETLIFDNGITVINTYSVGNKDSLLERQTLDPNNKREKHEYFTTLAGETVLYAADIEITDQQGWLKASWEDFVFLDKERIVRIPERSSIQRYDAARKYNIQVAVDRKYTSSEDFSEECFLREELNKQEIMMEEYRAVIGGHQKKEIKRKLVIQDDTHSKTWIQEFQDGKLVEEQYYEIRGSQVSPNLKRVCSQEGETKTYDLNDPDKGSVDFPERPNYEFNFEDAVKKIASGKKMYL